MTSIKARWRSAASALAATLIAATVLVASPTSAMAAPGCAAPTTLSTAGQVTLKKRLAKLNDQQVMSELLCLNVTATSLKPGGELRASIKPRYENMELSIPTLDWMNGGKWIGSSRLTTDGPNGWKATLKLTDAHGGMKLRAQVSEVDTHLALITPPEKWDTTCLEDLRNHPEVPKDSCLLDPSHTEEAIQEFWISGGTKLTSAAHSIAYSPIMLGKPAVTGSALVGNTLSAKVTGTSKAKKISYQWLRNGAAVKGATGKKYKLASADLGKKVSLRLTGSTPGHKTIVRTSPKTASVLRKLKNPNPRASIVGGKISCPMRHCTAKMTVKTTKNTGATVKYQWLRNGKAIKGATKSSHAVKYGYRKGAKHNVKYSVKVTVSKTRYKTVVQPSNLVWLPK